MQKFSSYRAHPALLANGRGSPHQGICLFLDRKALAIGHRAQSHHTSACDWLPMCPMRWPQAPAAAQQPCRFAFRVLPTVVSSLKWRPAPAKYSKVHISTPARAKCYIVRKSSTRQHASATFRFGCRGTVSDVGRRAECCVIRLLCGWLH
jgi:hypothetical protein